MATAAFQYNKLSATAFPLCSNADYILKTSSISSFKKKLLHWLMTVTLFVLTCQKSFTVLIVGNTTSDMSIMKTNLACRRPIHSKVITFTCFE